MVTRDILTDLLGLQEAVKAKAPKLTTDAALFETTPRQLREARLRAVVPHDSRLQRTCDSLQARVVGRAGSPGAVPEEGGRSRVLPQPRARASRTRAS